MPCDIVLVQDAAGQVPQVPGVYEWGALPQDGHFPTDIVTFYVGKAGTHFGNGRATLASRFSKYVCITMLPPDPALPVPASFYCIESHELHAVLCAGTCK
jgi:hypothetical protein